MTTTQVTQRWDVFGMSVRGRGRECNEDSFYISEDQTVLVVADGMGRMKNGHIASQQTVRIVSERLAEQDSFQTCDSVRRAIYEALHIANESLLEIVRSTPATFGMGTTCLVCVRLGDMCHIQSVGDSRAYHLGTDLRQLTSDETFAEFLVSIGQLNREQVRTSPRRNVLMRYVGSHDFQPARETIDVRLAVGDRLLLCSDGVTERLEDSALEHILRSKGTARDAAEAIMDQALKAGTLDDMTCIVVGAA